MSGGGGGSPTGNPGIAGSSGVVASYINYAPIEPASLFAASTSSDAQAGMSCGADVRFPPYFSAIYSDDPTEFVPDAAEAYELHVNTASGFTGMQMWGSGRVTISTGSGVRSSSIVYAGQPLAPGGTYYWRMRFWDAKGFTSPWSAACPFTNDRPPLTPSNASPANGRYEPRAVAHRPTTLTPRATSRRRPVPARTDRHLRRH